MSVEGGTLFSGMKAIGGRAYSAARAGVSAAMSADYGSSATVTPAPGRFFSRSAPEASTRGRERRSSTPSDAGSQNGSAAGDLPQLISPPDHSTTKDGSYYVAVLDLEPLCSNASTPSTPVVLSQYMVSKHQPISELTFSEDGTSLAVALKDGRAMRVYRLRPSPKEFRNQAAAEDKTSYDDNESPPPWHIYDLRRGRTPAIVEHVSWAHDARWLGVCTRKRTVHIFALNPYGGPTDEASHVKGKVMNVGEMVSRHECARVPALMTTLCIAAIVHRIVAVGEVARLEDAVERQIFSIDRVYFPPFQYDFAIVFDATLWVVITSDTIIIFFSTINFPWAIL